MGDKDYALHIPPTSPDGWAGANEWKWFVQMVWVYARLIRCRMHFAQAVYGDGEWHAILGDEGGTSNGQVYEPWLGEQLRRTLMEPVGQWCAYFGGPHKPLRVRCDDWLMEHRPAVEWLPRRILSAANCHGWLWPFLHAARTRRVVMVGPEHLKRLPAKVVDPAHLLTVSDNRAYEEQDRICDFLRSVVEPDDLVLLSVGLAAAVVIWKLWPEMKDRVTLYDAGAVWDPYCGVYSRKVYAQKDWQENIMPLNLR